MAVTIVNKPNQYNSVFNPNVWVLDSLNKSNDGFRYIVEVINVATGLPVIRENIAPRPIDGYGEINLSTILRDFVDVSVDFTALSTNFFSVTRKLRFEYKLRIGEEYFSSWAYTDTTFVTGGKTKITGSTAHPYSIGDVVEITPTNKLLFPSFSGVLNVVDVPTTTTVVFDVPFISTMVNPGVSKFADNRKIRVYNGTLTDAFQVFKGAIKFNEWSKTYVSNNLMLTDLNTKIATSYEDGYKITPNQDLFFSVWVGKKATNPVTMYWKRSDGATATQSISASNFTDNKEVYFNATNPFVFLGNAEYFDFWLVEFGSQKTEKKRIYIDRGCAVNDVSLLFEDRLGSLVSLAFKGFIQKDTDVTKEKYNQNVDLRTGDYNASIAKGTTIISVTSEDKYTLNSFSYSREQDSIFEDLIESSNVWIKRDGNRYPCEVTTLSMAFKDLKQTGLRRRTVTIKMANKDVING